MFLLSFNKNILINIKNKLFINKIFIMAKKAISTTTAKVFKPKKKRPGVHSKSKSSKCKNSKLYLKKNHGQG